MFNNLTVQGKLIEIGKHMLKQDLVWGKSGNISARIDEDKMLVTSSGTHIGNLGDTDFALCDINSSKWEGVKKPTKEVPMHKGIYKQRPEASIVLHSSPFYTTLISCSDEYIPSSLFIETMYYLGNIETIEYYQPGSDELGKAVEEKSKNANIIIMKNHGVILFDKTFEDTLMRLQTLEIACRMIVTAKSSGIRLNHLSVNQIQEFVRRGY